MTTQEKPREFWIDHDEWYSEDEKKFNDKTCTGNEWNPKNLIHVIEKSAFDAVVVERDQAVDQSDFHYEIGKGLLKACQDKDAEIQRLRKALRNECACADNEGETVKCDACKALGGE